MDQEDVIQEGQGTRRTDRQRRGRGPGGPPAAPSGWKMNPQGWSSGAARHPAVDLNDLGHFRRRGPARTGSTTLTGRAEAIQGSQALIQAAESPSEERRRGAQQRNQISY